MSVLLIGKKGQIGHELRRLLRENDGYAAVDFPDIDLSSPDSIVSAINRFRPRLVVNAAAYTAVDRAENEPDLAMAINGTAPGIIAEELKKTGGALVHYSTDYVFDGSKAAPYSEEDTPNPLSVYGRTKLAGEEAIRNAGIPHLLIRTSWIYGARGQNFLLTVLRLAREREELRIVSDQIGAPTWCRTVPETTADILARAGAVETPAKLADRGGPYHLTAAGETNWYEFAREILNLDPEIEEQMVKDILPIPTSEYPTPAPRPLNSRLDCSLVEATFGIELPSWYESLRLVMDGLQP